MSKRHLFFPKPTDVIVAEGITFTCLVVFWKMVVLDSWRRGLPFTLWWFHLHSLLAGSLGQRLCPWCVLPAREVSSCGEKSGEWETALLGAWSTVSSGGWQRRDLFEVPKRDCIGLMCQFTGVQCRGFFFLTYIWSYLTPNGPEFSSFLVLVCALRRGNVRNSELLGTYGGRLLGRKGVGGSSVMCDHSGAEEQCFSCVEDGKFEGRREARLHCVISLHSGEMSEAVLCAFHKHKPFFSAVLQ